MLGRLSDTGDTNGEDTTSSSSEEEKEADCSQPEKEPGPKTSWDTNGPANGQLLSQEAPAGDTTKDEDELEEEEDCLPTIYFSHTVEPKKVGLHYFNELHFEK